MACVGGGALLGTSYLYKSWEKSGRWGLFEKTPKLHFLHLKIIFEVRIKPLCDYTFTAGPDLM